MASCLSIVGVGLIGGSFALASRKAGSFSKILAVEPDGSNAAKALSLGLVDEVVSEIPSDCDAVLVACPSDRVAQWLETLQDHPGIVFDAASVKGAILSATQAAIGHLPANYVPCHPIAGLEKSGPDAADAELFNDKLVIITPTTATDHDRCEQVVQWWQECGARIDQMDAFEHDRVYALTSHLPHLLAFAYLQGVSAEHMPHTGGGFRDFSRIGASDSAMWSAIFELNKDALLPRLAEFQKNLDGLRRVIESGDVAASRALIDAARTQRRELDDDC